ncbi:neuronal acetylcholine receptor subunit alpha-7-like isoform X2 [Apostichopus japonicus]|uniref:neuronal acetylcholine receptor subunit alpha-7-like isoform X2 n=1 Tax=Stichopus japonicus TaxID=307972 RepID=UPI003AB548E3
MPEIFAGFQFFKVSILNQVLTCVLLTLLFSTTNAHEKEFEGIYSSDDTYPDPSIIDDLPGHNERRLLTNLLDNYPHRSMVLPSDSYDGENPLQVSIGMTLVQILNVDEKNQVITLNVWLSLAWLDKSLVWEPDEYGGLSEIHLNPKKVWTPDILLYTSADERFDATFHVNTIATYDGSVTWLPPGLVRSTCAIDVTYFPFDVQRCFLKYGVWTYHGHLVDLVLSDEATDTTSFLTNGEWLLQNLTANRTIEHYACCPEPYPDVKFYIYLRRRSMYYTVNILIPCVVLSVLSLLSFILPAETGEKLSFCITLLLGLNIFMGLLGGKLPTTSTSIPLLGKYFTCVLILVSVSVIMTITTINLNSRNPNTHKMHRWVRKVLLEWLPIILWMKQPGRTYKPLCGTAERDKIAGQTQRGIELLENAPTYKDRRGNGSATQSNYFNDVNLIGIKYANYATDEHEPMIADTRTGPKERRNRELCLILEELRALNGRHERQDRDEQVIYDWKFASMVVDRMSLLIISLITVIVTFKILWSAPTFVDDEPIG